MVRCSSLLFGVWWCAVPPCCSVCNGGRVRWLVIHTLVFSFLWKQWCETGGCEPRRAPEEDPEQHPGDEGSDDPRGSANLMPACQSDARVCRSPLQNYVAEHFLPLTANTYLYLLNRKGRKTLKGKWLLVWTEEQTGSGQDRQMDQPLHACFWSRLLHRAVSVSVSVSVSSPPCFWGRLRRCMGEPWWRGWHMGERVAHGWAVVGEGGTWASRGGKGGTWVSRGGRGWHIPRRGSGWRVSRHFWAECIALFFRPHSNGSNYLQNRLRTNPLSFPPDKNMEAKFMQYQ